MAAKLREDYPIDAMALEAERRSKKLGRPYSYGQLMADTTRPEREQIEERYRQARKEADRKGRYRVGQAGFGAAGKSVDDVVRQIRRSVECDPEE